MRPLWSVDYELLCVHNFTPATHPTYFLRLPGISSITEVFNSDSERFGGSGKGSFQIPLVRDGEGNTVGVHLQIAPLATQIFQIRN